MMGAILAFDWWLLDYAERWANRIQLWTGWDCFLQARAFYGVAALAQLLQFVAALRARVGFWGVTSGVFFLLISFWYAFLATGGRNTEEWRRRLIEAGFPNPQKGPDYAWMRVALVITWFFVSIIPLSFWENRLFMTSALLAMYMSACDPRPPSKGCVTTIRRPESAPRQPRN